MGAVGVPAPPPTARAGRRTVLRKGRRSSGGAGRITQSRARTKLIDSGRRKLNAGGDGRRVRCDKQTRPAARLDPGATGLTTGGCVSHGHQSQYAVSRALRGSAMSVVTVYAVVAHRRKQRKDSDS